MGLKTFGQFVAEDKAYKGYLICTDAVRGTTRIEKDKFHISYAKDEADAKQIIDMLTEETAPKCPKCHHPLRTAWSNKDEWACVSCDETWPKSELTTEDEGAGAPVNSAGGGNIAGLGIGKAGKPANWGEPGGRKRQDEASDDIVTELVQEGLLESTDPSDTFAGAPVFDVDMDRVMKSRFGKNRYHRYSRYVGEDEVGEAIRQHGRGRKSGNIVLRDSKTNVMTYLRRKNTGAGIM